MRLKLISAAVLASAAILAGPARAATLDPATVILENGPVKITVADFEAAMTRFPEHLRAEARANPETILKIIDVLFVNRMLAERAKTEGIDRDPALRLRMAQLEEGFLAQKYLEQVEKDFKVPGLESRAEELYKADPKKFVVPAMVELSDVVIGLNGRTPEIATARAREARAKLEAGTPLADVVRQYSDDPSASRHRGNLGWVQAADLDPAVAEAAFALKPGEWSAPIVTRNGVHVMRVSGKREAVQQKFADVKATLVEEEADRLKKRAAEEVLKRIRSDKANTIYPDRVEALKSQIDPAMIDKAHRDAIEKIQSQR